MADYLQSIRHTAVSILNGGRAWDGGIFEVVGSNDLLINYAINKTLDRRLLTGDIKSTFFSSGALVALIFTVLLAAVLVVFSCISMVSRCRSARRGNLFGQKLRVQVRKMDDQFPVPLRALFGLVCGLLLLLSLIPLILTFATNSRLHASVSETVPHREGTVVHQLNRAFAHLDSFLSDIVPNARQDSKPVLNRTLEMTKAMKTKSQMAYQGAFEDVIGATQLKSSSNELLRRLGIFYYEGKRLKEDEKKLSTALSDIEETKIHDMTEQCKKQIGTDICLQYKTLEQLVLQKTTLITTRWKHTKGSHVYDEVRKIEYLVGNLAATLDTVDSSPKQQQAMKEAKLKVSREFNHNITSVFDKELNSTAFVMNSMDEQMEKIENMTAGARQKLTEMLPGINKKYAVAGPKYDGLRFIVTLIILLLLLLTLVYVSTSSTVVLLLPNVANKKTGVIVSGIYGSYFVYAVALIFTFILFGTTSFLQTETCRYLLEEPTKDHRNTIDKFLLPDVNEVIRLMKERARNDPNATDKIPLTQLGRLFGGIQEGCKQNLPILRALQSVKYFDPSTSDSSEKSLQFKEKGRDILRREMNKADLTVLRDEEMLPKMNNLRKMFMQYNTRNFSQLAVLLAEQERSIADTKAVIDEFQAVNSALNFSSSSDITLVSLTTDEMKKASAALEFMDYFVKNYTNSLSVLEANKDVVSVIDRVIEASKLMDVYLLNKTLWTDTAVFYYTKYVINESAEESQEIAVSTAEGFLSILAKCRGVYDFYQAATGVPCRSVLYPMSIIWFCLGWSICFSILFSLFAHLSVVCFVRQTSEANGARQETGDSQIWMEEK